MSVNAKQLLVKNHACLVLGSNVIFVKMVRNELGVSGGYIIQYNLPFLK